MLPRQVMQEANNEFLNYRDCGMSVMELNHRSVMFNEILDEAKKTLIDLMDIPDNYEILFLQGGAALQFAAIPMNLMKKGKAGFLITGHWAKRAYDEAMKYGESIQLASSEDDNYSYIPQYKKTSTLHDLDYVHICDNNTIYGTEFKSIPDFGECTLVSDMSSNILSKIVDVSKYGLIFAGAQKNMGPAGVTVVIVRKDLVTDDVLTCTPSVMKYKNQVDQNSRYNTPSTYGIYMCGKVFRWIKQNGGIETMQELNQKKAQLVYDYIDESSLFFGTADKRFRSTMNVTFTTGNDELDMVIVEDSKKKGFVSLKGHRFVGGLRASLYNAIPMENVEALVHYLKQFERDLKRT